MNATRISLLVALLCLTGSSAAHGQTYTVLHSFTGAEGVFPHDNLIVSGSTLYGMTSAGGSGNNQGTVFKISTDGAGLTVLHSFSTGNSGGAAPHGGLTLIGSTLYGMAPTGGINSNGTVFQVGIDGSGFNVMHSFTGYPGDGAHPYGSLTYNGSTLFGMTFDGGSYGMGSAFGMNADGSGYSLVHSFAGFPDGAHPWDNLTLSGTTLYGMTQQSGANGDGAVFKMGLDGTGYSILRSFAGDGQNGDGWAPLGSLVLNGSTLYGLTRYGGGSGNYGTIFKVATDGSDYSVLHSLIGSDGANPFGSLTLLGSTLYGMTFNGGASGDGTIFQIGLDGGDFRVLHSFGVDVGDGANPWGSLTLDGSTLYGMTSLGGNGGGTIFALTVPEPSTLTLLAVGAIGLAACAWRRWRRQETTPATPSL